MTNFFAITVANLATVAKYLPYLYCLNETGRSAKPARALLFTFFKEFYMRITRKVGNSTFTFELTQTVVLSILTMIALAT